MPNQVPPRLAALNGNELPKLNGVGTASMSGLPTRATNTGSVNLERSGALGSSFLIGAAADLFRGGANAKQRAATTSASLLGGPTKPNPRAPSALLRHKKQLSDRKNESGSQWLYPETEWKSGLGDGDEDFYSGVSQQPQSQRSRKGGAEMGNSVATTPISRIHAREEDSPSSRSSPGSNDAEFPGPLPPLDVQSTYRAFEIGRAQPPATAAPGVTVVRVKSKRGIGSSGSSAGTSVKKASAKHADPRDDTNAGPDTDATVSDSLSRKGPSKSPPVSTGSHQQQDTGKLAVPQTQSPAQAAELDQVVRTALAPPPPRGAIGRPIERAVSVHQRGPFKYELGDFVLQKSLGQGAFAKVYLVKRNIDGKLFALKSMRKDNVVKMQQVQHVQNERHLMENVRNPFLVGLEATFQDSQHIFMIIDYMPGGDLFGQIQRLGHFEEPLARFYATEVAMALSYLHSENIVYRDLKPENVLLDVTGHAKLGDFGFAKVIDGTTRTFCGTPSYIPPEILLHKEYSSAVDWWSFGVLLFEMLSGCSPFQEDTAARTYERILQGTIQWPLYRSKYFSKSAEGLITALLVFSPFQRLGCQDESEIRDHPFFATVDWRQVKTRKQPVVRNNTLRRSASSGNGFSQADDAVTSFEISAWRSNSVVDAKNVKLGGYNHEMFKDF